jgi:phosphate starvation-inducible membrane PsiE
MKGQITVITLMYLLVAVILLFVMLPTVVHFGDNAKSSISGSSNADLVGTVIDLVPFFMLLGLIVTIIIYANPPRE